MDVLALDSSSERVSKSLPFSRVVGVVEMNPEHCDSCDQVLSCLMDMILMPTYQNASPVRKIT